MNNWTTPLEKQLGSWQPRRPSAEVKAAILAGRPAKAEPAEHGSLLELGLALRRLAPVSVAACLAILIIGPKATTAVGLDAMNSPAAFAMAAFSNQFYAAYMPSVDHSVRNNSTAFSPSGPCRGLDAARGATPLSMATNDLRW